MSEELENKLREKADEIARNRFTEPTMKQIVEIETALHVGAEIALASVSPKIEAYA